MRGRAGLSDADAAARDAREIRPARGFALPLSHPSPRQYLKLLAPDAAALPLGLAEFAVDSAEPQRVRPIFEIEPREQVLDQRRHRKIVEPLPQIVRQRVRPSAEILVRCKDCKTRFVARVLLIAASRLSTRSDPRIFCGRRSRSILGELCVLPKRPDP